MKQNEAKTISLHNLVLSSVQSEWLIRKTENMGLSRSSVIKVIINDAIKRELDNDRVPK